MIKYIFACSLVGVFALAGEVPVVTTVTNNTYKQCLNMETAMGNTVTQSIKLCKGKS